MSSIRPYIWSFINTGGAQVIGFLSSMIIARVAMPSDFGILAICAAIILVCNIFSEGGLASIIIVDKDFCEKKASTILWIIIILSITVFMTLNFFTSLIADYLNYQVIESVLPLMAFSILATAFGAVHAAIVVRQMRFKTKAILSISSSLCGSIIGILISYTYDPLMGLIAIFTISPILLSCGLWIFIRWNISFSLKPSLIYKDITFSLNISGSNLLDQISKSLLIFLFNNTYGLTNLGLYNRADAIKNISSNAIDKSVQRVSFPILSMKNHIKTEKAFLEHIKISTSLILLLSPLVFFISNFAENIVLIIYGQNWLNSAPILSLLIFGGIFIPITSVNLSLLKSTGYSSLLTLNKLLALLLIPIVFFIAQDNNLDYFLKSLIVYFISLYFVSVISISKVQSFSLSLYFSRIVIVSIITSIPMILFNLIVDISISNNFLNLLLNVIIFISFIMPTYFIFWKYIYDKREKI
tara:strand:+ start:1731 stop:3140 length:1410 start_codon:yes stop_codon:yes gene_type:complete